MALEIERKYLIKKPTPEQFKRIGNVKKSIYQVYLKSDDPNVERRIRRSTLDHKTYKFMYNEKKGSGLTRIEDEYEIAELEFMMLVLHGYACIEKDRYLFKYNGQKFELDVYLYPEWEREAILEIELESEEQIVYLPKWIKLIKEVTNDENYKNSKIAGPFVLK